MIFHIDRFGFLLVAIFNFTVVYTYGYSGVRANQGYFDTFPSSPLFPSQYRYKGFLITLTRNEFIHIVNCISRASDGVVSAHRGCMARYAPVKIFNSLLNCVSATSGILNINEFYYLSRHYPNYSAKVFDCVNDDFVGYTIREAKQMRAFEECSIRVFNYARKTCSRGFHPHVNTVSIAETNASTEVAETKAILGSSAVVDISAIAEDIVEDGVDRLESDIDTSSAVLNTSAAAVDTPIDTSSVLGSAALLGSTAAVDTFSEDISADGVDTSTVLESTAALQSPFAIVRPSAAVETSAATVETSASAEDLLSDGVYTSASAEDLLSDEVDISAYAENIFADGVDTSAAVVDTSAVIETVPGSTVALRSSLAAIEAAVDTSVEAIDASAGAVDISADGVDTSSILGSAPAVLGSAPAVLGSAPAALESTAVIDTSAAASDTLSHAEISEAIIKAAALSKLG